MPEATESGGASDAVDVLGHSATVFVDDFAWHGRALGRFSAKIDTSDKQVKLEDVRLAGARSRRAWLRRMR